MKLILAADDGTILDSVEVTREDWDNLSTLGAYELLRDLAPGDAS